MADLMTDYRTDAAQLLLIAKVRIVVIPVQETGEYIDTVF